MESNINIWREKPIIVESQEVDSKMSPSSVVYYLKDVDQIVNIVSVNFPRKWVSFSFYESQPPFKKKLKHHTVATLHEQTRAMLVNDLGVEKEKSTNLLMAIVEDQRDKKLVTFQKDIKQDEFEAPKVHPLKKIRDSRTDHLVNCFIMKGKNLLMVTSLGYTVFEYKVSEQKVFNLIERSFADINLSPSLKRTDDFLGNALCCKADISANGNCFLMSLD